MSPLIITIILGVITLIGITAGIIQETTSKDKSMAIAVYCIIEYFITTLYLVLGYFFIYKAGNELKLLGIVQIKFLVFITIIVMWYIFNTYILLKLVKPAYIKLFVNIIFYVIAGLSLFVTFLFYIRGTVNIFLLWAFVLAIASIIVVLVFTVKHITHNPKSLIIVAIVIIGGMIIFSASYGISYLELQRWPLTLSEEIANSISRYTPNLVGAGLYTAVILLLVAFAGIIYSSVVRLMKS